MKLWKYIIPCAALIFAVSCTPGGGGGEPTGGKNEYKRVNHLLDQFDRAIVALHKNHERPARVYIVAHRANTYAGVNEKYLPDNSLPAIEEAIAAGADMVELDVRYTKDGVHVLMHNATINETTEGTGNVKDKTLAELKALKMRRSNHYYFDSENGDYARVPTLAEALACCKDRIYINLDCKDIVSEKELIEEIEAAGMQDQVMIYGGSYLDKCSKENPNIALHPYVSSISDLAKTPYMSAVLFQFGYYKYDMSDSKKYDPDFARQLHERDKLGYSNILDHDKKLAAGDYTMLDRFIDCDIDFIQTDYAEVVDAYLKEKGLR